MKPCKVHGTQYLSEHGCEKCMYEESLASDGDYIPKCLKCGSEAKHEINQGEYGDCFSWYSLFSMWGNLEDMNREEEVSRLCDTCYVEFKAWMKSTKADQDPKNLQIDLIEGKLIIALLKHLQDFYTEKYQIKKLKDLKPDPKLIYQVDLIIQDLENKAS